LAGIRTFDLDKALCLVVAMTMTMTMALDDRVMTRRKRGGVWYGDFYWLGVSLAARAGG